jgi:hypothetical protein
MKKGNEAHAPYATRACCHYEEAAKIQASLLTILQVLSVAIFERKLLLGVLAYTDTADENSSNNNRQFFFSLTLGHTTDALY